MRILIFNFFDGILVRGIPLYVQNLRVALEQEGVSCSEMVCPASLRRLPRPLLNVLFVVWEQLLAPIYGLRCDRVIHPYNSASILNSITGKSLLVVHDFIFNSKRNKTLVARYVRTTQRIHARLGGDVAYVSRSTERIGKTVNSFRRSQTYLFPNSFFRFMRTQQKSCGPKRDYVLLCTGWGTNKDLPGALALYCESGLWRKRDIRTLGLAGHTEVVDAFRAAHPDVAKHITVLPRLRDADVAEEYSSAAWVWVHSAKEGYGRSIAEAKLCGCRVVASDIAPFREQRDEGVFLYAGLQRFLEACENCEVSKQEYPIREPMEHEVLRAEIRRYLAENVPH